MLSDLEHDGRSVTQVTEDREAHHAGAASRVEVVAAWILLHSATPAWTSPQARV